MKVKHILLVIFLTIVGIGNECVLYCGNWDDNDKGDQKQDEEKNSDKRILQKRREIREKILEHLELYEKIIEFVLEKINNEKIESDLKQECANFNKKCNKQYTIDQYEKIREKIKDNKEVAQKFKEKIKSIKKKDQF